MKTPTPDMMKPESLQLLQRYLKSKKNTSIKLSFKERQQAVRWTIVMSYTKSNNHVLEKIPVCEPSKVLRTLAKDDLQGYYYEVKYLLQGYKGLLKDEEWFKMARNCIREEDMDTGVFDPDMFGASDEVFWAIFDAAVSSWTADLPPLLPGQGYHKYDFPNLENKCIDTLPYIGQMEFLKHLGQSAVEFFFLNPHLRALYEYIDELDRLMSNLGAYLQKSIRYPGLYEWYKNRTSLPSHGIVLEYAVEVGCCLTGEDFINLSERAPRLSILEDEFSYLESIGVAAQYGYQG